MNDNIYEQNEKDRLDHEKRVNEYWANLSEEEREMAFCAVCSRIYTGDIENQQTYRGVLYETFGFGPHMYRHGMNSGYLIIHNAIQSGEEMNWIRNGRRLVIKSGDKEIWASEPDVSISINYNKYLASGTDETRTVTLDVNKGYF